MSDFEQGYQHGYQDAVADVRVAKKVTEADAKKVLRALGEQYGQDFVFSDTEGAKIVKDFDWGAGPAPYAIVWEDGPFQWTYNFPYGGINEEMASMAEEFAEFGNPQDLGKIKDVSDMIPPNVFVEAYTQWAVGIYEG